MSDLTMVSPLLDGTAAEETLSTHDGISVFRIRHLASGIRCIVKRISIPESAGNTEALIFTGAVKDKQEADQYYQSVVNGYRKELSAFRKLAVSPYIRSYARFQVVPMEDQPGYQIYLLAPCRTSLRAYLEQNAITQKMAVQLGMDLCRSLQALREQDYIYLDLKPENVFLEGGKFCIGDFGLTQRSDLRFAALPARYLSNYTAPEACDVTGELGETTDLYAVGMLLYYIYNGNHVPFEEAGTTDKVADSRRISGEALPAPLYADYEMDAIIRKACAFRPEDRYQTPDELLLALQDYLERNTVTDDCIVPPLVLDDLRLPDEEPMEEEAEPVTFAKAETLTEDFRESFTPSQEPEDEAQPKKKKRHIWIPIVLAVLVLLAAGLGYFYFEYSALVVDKIAVTDKGTDYLTVSIQTENYDNLVITCTPDGGSATATYRCAETVTFTDLQPGTVYRVLIDATDWHYVKGVLGGTAATASLTEVLSFETETQEDGTDLAVFQVSGPEPEEWTLRCTSAAGEDHVLPVADHTAVLEGLLPNCDYTLTLTANAGYYLSGMLSIPYSYTVPISGSNLAAVSLSDESITVTWDSDSDIATQWTAVCSGDNGYASMLVTDQCTAVFEDTPVGAEYTIAVSNATMTMPMLLTVKTTACQISDFTAEADGTAVHLKWSATGEIPATWTLTYGPEAASEATSVEITGTSADLEGLIPDAGYVFTLTDAGGNELGGAAEVTARTGETELYTDHDFGSIFIGLYEKTGASWTVSSLGEVKESFAVGTPIVCVIESEATPQQQEDPETIESMLVIRDSSGRPVACNDTETHNWNEMWSGNLFGAAIDMVPETAGTYKLELYFNNQLLRSAEFTIG